MPYDAELGVHPQAELFTHYDVWDFDRTGPDRYPLFLHFPYFDLYRRQVVKQADLVLAMQLRDDAFTEDQKARNFAYYEALTVRDSSLSAISQAVLAAELGHLDLAYDYLSEVSQHGPRRSAPQHPQRAAHGIAGRRLDDHRGRLRWAAGPQRPAVLRPQGARGHLPAVVQLLVPAPQPVRDRHAGPDALRAARGRTASPCSTTGSRSSSPPTSRRSCRSRRSPSGPGPPSPTAGSPPAGRRRAPSV